MASNVPEHKHLDVMISYSRVNQNVMRKLKDFLIENGLKAFLIILSKNSATSKYCRDELALAYISNKPIIPVALEKKSEILSVLEFGMKLTLASMEWISLADDMQFDQQLSKIIAAVNTFICDTDVSEHNNNSVKSQDRLVNRQISKHKKLFHDHEEKDFIRAGEKFIEFLKDYYRMEDTIPWTLFEQKFYEINGPELEKLCSFDNEGWLLGVLYRELEVLEANENVTKQQLLAFTDNNIDIFWENVEEQAIQSYAMREVFNMDSSVRIPAIMNLSKIKSPAVMEALSDLLTDKDPNIRSVAAISLGRLGVQNNLRITRRLINLLNDSDRLVREAGCLALGHMKAQPAVRKLVKLWRNDTISHVREAAQCALKRIGGEEAEKALHITKVLTEEIRALTTKNNTN
ncbi:uncharacterized protein TRIADDRAFT_59119 [Trichoplax adhaerens]|uniref:TIR domain-containing protein n=1 Tax=Trichoplax adhaerens TaxID=10228 RepID=B3S4K5_TRIAD|nr:hypothetical protein TRIADDRAFT_59119 [Trichoplax adhaerens]EDV22484.1 hypothetical protein TRIADDRAFT_59119 [Trichoplax adhaerens]|eukprot:XP_002115028.1 hypothetical protein TRIADDRAFT_59119 [Trichoplax adhaerens]